MRSNCSYCNSGCWLVLHCNYWSEGGDENWYVAFSRRVVEGVVDGVCCMVFVGVRAVMGTGMQPLVGAENCEVNYKCIVQRWRGAAL